MKAVVQMDNKSILHGVKIVSGKDKTTIEVCIDPLTDMPKIGLRARIAAAVYKLILYGTFSGGVVVGCHVDCPEPPVDPEVLREATNRFMEEHK